VIVVVVVIATALKIDLMRLSTMINSEILCFQASIYL